MSPVTAAKAQGIWPEGCKGCAALMVELGIKKDDLVHNIPTVQERVMDDLMHVAQRLAAGKEMKPLKSKSSDVKAVPCGNSVKAEPCSVKAEPCSALVPVKEEEIGLVPGPENRRLGEAWIDRWEDQHMGKDELVRCGLAKCHVAKCNVLKWEWHNHVPLPHGSQSRHP